MEEYYKELNFSEPIKFSNIKKVNNLTLPDSVQLVSVVITRKNAFGSEINNIYEYYVVQLKNEGFKIDWLSSIGYNKLSLKAYQATKPSEVGIFRLDCKLSDYYNYGYIDLQNKYYSIECYSEFDESIIYAYVDKNSDDGKKIFEILKDGNNHKLVLAVKYDYKSENTSDILSLKKLVTVGWYFNEKSKITIPETLQEFIQYSNLDTTFIYEMTDGKIQKDPLTTRIKYGFDGTVFTINTQGWFQGHNMSNYTEYCNLNDSILEVTRMEGQNALTGRVNSKFKKVLVKLPVNNKSIEWSYVDSDGTTYWCSSAFTNIDFKGEKVKAILVTEKNSYFKDITTFRFYLKGFGLYEESKVPKDGKKVYTKRLIQ